MKQKDVIRISDEKAVPKATIDKDWVLGHFLNAMYSFDEIRKNFIFKGGTCLHKCFIKDYWFSEDLDFTLIDKGFTVDKPFINRIIKVAQKNSTIKFHLAKLGLQQHNDVPQGYKAEIKFWGADHRPNQRPLPASRWQTGIHLDISFLEKLVLPPVELAISHPYPDEAFIKNTSVCYDFKELVAEKIRSLKQRNRPRDIYDVWFLCKEIPQTGHSEIKTLLLEKSAQKKLVISGPEDFVNEDKQIRNKRAWSDSLAHQVSMKTLPGFDQIYNELAQFIHTLLND